MRALPVNSLRALTTLAVALVALTGTAGFARAAEPMVVDVDLRTAEGVRVATLYGSLGANGRGYGDIARMAGAAGIGMRRGERVVLRRLDDGSIRVGGGLGTNLSLWPALGGSQIGGDGRLALEPRAAETRYVVARGLRTSEPYRPRGGHVMLVLGRPTGTLRAAVDRRYRLVRYSDEWSRTRLLSDPARYAQVAGVLVGPDIDAHTLSRIDLPDALYGAGRWVGATGDGRAFERAMREHIHASIGRGGVLVRRPNAAPGMTTHEHLQIREPRYARVRVGERRLASARPTRATVRRAVRASARHLDQGLRRGEMRGAAPAPFPRQGQPGMAITPSKPNLAYYTVAVDQQIVIDLTVPSVFATQVNGTLAEILFMPYGQLPLPAEVTLEQTLNIAMTPQYTVSLDGQGLQTVTETSSSTVSTLVPANGALGAGTYDETTNLVTPLQANGAFVVPRYPGLASGATMIDPPGPYVQQAGLGLLAGYHSVVLDAQTATPASATFNAARSAPTQQVTQVGGNWSSGTDWEQSTTSSSSWSISGTLGIGTGSPSGITGGYTSETDNTSSNGGSLSTSVNSTLSNWTTNPLQQNDPSAGSAQAAYSTFSSAIPDAGGLAAPAASSLSYPTALDAPNGSLTPAPAGYGGNGPGPGCTYQFRGFTPTPWSCWAIATPPTFGSGMNVTGYQQGSVSSFIIDPQGSALQVPGTAQPRVIDNVLLAETFAFPATAAADLGLGTTSMTFTQLQIIDQADVDVAQLVPSETGGTRNVVLAPTQEIGRGINQGITTYFGPQGQQINGARSGTYSTTGLDLCAPPVLTVELWESGCSTGYVSEPPATVYGAGPAVGAIAPAVIQEDGAQAFAVQGATLVCESGTWSGSPTYAFQWQVWGSVNSGWSPIAGATGRTYTPTEPGYYLCTVIGENADGTASSSSLSVQIIEPAPVPTLGSVAPSSGSTAGGTSVTLSGADLLGATAVTFGGVPATAFAVESATQITATAPAGTAGVVDIAIVTPGGTATLPSGFTYVASAPTVTAVEPGSGTTAGGTTVTITGANLTGATAVSFNGVAAASFSVINATTITAVTPAGNAGTVDILVTTPGGSAVGSFRYVAPAPSTVTTSVTAVSPTSGSANGGTQVAIIGRGFTGATDILFGGVPAASFTVVSDTYITAVSPAGAVATVGVIVVSPTGSAELANAFTLLAPPAPAVTVDPLRGALPVTLSTPTTVAVPITCALQNAVIGQCTVSITTGSTALGAATAVALPGATAMQVIVPLNGAGRAALRTGRPVAIRIGISATTTSGATATGSSAARLVVPNRISTPAGAMFTATGALTARGRSFARTVASILPPRPASITCAGFEGGVPARTTTRRLGDARATALCLAVRADGIRPGATRVVWLLPGGGGPAPSLPAAPAAILVD